MIRLRKAVAVVIAALTMASAAAQNLRDKVCIVKGNLSNENSEFLAKIQDSLKTEGYSYYAKYIESFLKGTFGSGFIWYAQDGKPYIVTNGHVVYDYETVNISFENEDGSVSEFKDMKIVFTDDDVDVALVGLPASFKKEGLVLSSTKVSDGDDVFSAGFPGLAGEPSWQLGKGIVSNASTKVKELLDPSISTLIQHTAQIDGGNSGGPLLVKDSSAKAGYKVCGINTWKAIARQNTNFAIPASTLESIVKSNFINGEKTSFESRSKAFVESASKDKAFSAIAPFVSNSMISNYGETALKEVLGKSSSSVRSYVSDIFEANPIEGLRYALAYQIRSKIDIENRLNVTETSDETSGKNVKFTAGESSYDSFWIQEHGLWKISEFEGIKADKKKTDKEKARNTNGSSVTFEDPYLISVGGGFSRNFTEEDNGFYLDLAFRANFVSVGMSLMTESLTFMNEDEYSSTSPEEATASMACIGPFIQLKVPVKVRKVVIMPFAEARAGLAFTSDLDMNLKPFFAGLGGGLELAYCTDSDVSPYLGMKFLSNSYKSEAGESYSVKDLVIFAGIKFSEK